MALPARVKPKSGSPAAVHAVKKLLRKGGLHTICEAARCPNMGECFSRKTAAFLILGEICSRSCAFCAVKKGAPAPPSPREPLEVARAAKALGLKHLVITSVTRDDLPDGGAAQFVKTVEAVRAETPRGAVELLIPDFGGNTPPLDSVIAARPEIINHNIETVPRLYPRVRPQADYRRSLEVISRVHGASLPAKSGVMLGMGEERDEIINVMENLLEAGCDIITMGQYLKPGRHNPPVHRYLDPAEFDEYGALALKMGFVAVAAGPLVRSSYRAEEMAVLPPHPCLH